MKISGANESLGELLGSWAGSGAVSSEDTVFQQQLAATEEDTSKASAGTENGSGGAAPSAATVAAAPSPPVANLALAQAPSSNSGPLTASAPWDPNTLVPMMSVSELDITPATPGVTMLTARSSWSADLEKRSTDAVRTELAKMGLDASKVRMVYWEEMCWYPGGNFPARTITVQTPNGGKADFDAGLTLLTPQVTARDIANLMRGAPMEG